MQVAPHCGSCTGGDRAAKLPRKSRSHVLTLGGGALPKVAVMIINYNGLRWLRRCLPSVLKTRYPKYEIFLVDNGSVDRSTEYVRAEYPFVNVIGFSKNLGFGEAYNRAISQTDAEYIVLLNNDTEILEPKWLHNLAQAADDPNVGAIALKMVSMQDHGLLDSVGGMGIPYWRGFVDVGKGELDTNQYRDDFEPFAFCGGAALIKKSAFEDVGKFDGDMFLYFEDADVSWRLRLLGWKIRYAPKAKVAHMLGGSTGGSKLNALRLYYTHRNLLRSILKNCGSSLGWALRNYLLFSMFMVSGYLIYGPRMAVVVLRGIVWNLRNLKTTYANRLRVQTRRRAREHEILRYMYPGLPRKVPEEFASLRHILDIIFECSNRAKYQQEFREPLTYSIAP